MMNGLLPHLEPDYSEFVEVDPTGRYGRYKEILGKGASKTVYRAFDEYEGIEVAWNQVKLYDFLQSPEDLERLYCEIHLLKTLKHQNIMKFYTSWVDTSNRNINFVTEMFTSGTLKQYREKHKRVNIRAVKHWCRQILGGLLYLHSHDPPVIHRDLKCDNIFINGNQGQVKIGDLGLAAILRKSHAAHCVGTPEFMAPEVYAEEYNELVDIYSFGMCILEMVTFEYPYSECTHPAQIYKKVISGKKPDALYKVRDPEVRQFVEKCLATVTLRLSAEELLNDPFLQIDDDRESELRLIECRRETAGYMMDPTTMLRQPPPYLELVEYEGNPINDNNNNSSFSNINGGYSNGGVTFQQNGWDYHSTTDIEQSGIELFDYNDEEEHEDDHSANVDITIKGKRREDGSIFLRLRISDRDGHIRNIYFPFDVESDTALSVATEMVAELDITDQDVTNIADMIDGEIGSLVPDWKPGPGIEETPRFASAAGGGGGLCFNCASNHTSTGSFINFLSNGANKLLISQCAGNGCAAAMHGRFEEITTYNQEVDDDEPPPPPPPPHEVVECASHGPPPPSTSSLLHINNGFHYPEIWDHLESLECSTSQGSGEVHHHDGGREEELDRAKNNNNNKTEEEEEDEIEHKVLDKSFSGLHDNNLTTTNPSLSNEHSDDYEQEIQQELRWLRAKYQMELRKLRDQQLLGLAPKSPKPAATDDDEESSQRGVVGRCEAVYSSSCPNGSGEEDMVVTAKSFYEEQGSVVPYTTLHRSTSLLVDAVDL